MLAQCAKCGFSKNVPDSAAGKKAKCPKCASVIVIGRVSDTAEAGAVFACPCGFNKVLPPDKSGKKARCPKCGQINVVKGAEPAAPAPPPTQEELKAQRYAAAQAALAEADREVNAAKRAGTGPSAPTPDSPPADSSSKQQPSSQAFLGFSNFVEKFLTKKNFFILASLIVIAVVVLKVLYPDL